MLVFAIDPGPEKSAWLLYNAADQRIVGKYDGTPNAEVCKELAREGYVNYPMVVEMVASYGMSVGASTFETCVWIGRFMQAWPGLAYQIYRKRKTILPLRGRPVVVPSICMHLCKNNTAKDSNISQALRDRFPQTGGGKTPSVGTKKQPGPLYGVSKHLWSALAVAVTFADHYPKEIEDGS